MALNCSALQCIDQYARQHFCRVQVSNIAIHVCTCLANLSSPSNQFGKQLPQNLLKPFISTNVQLMATCVAFLHSRAIFYPSLDHVTTRGAQRKTQNFDPCFQLAIVFLIRNSLPHSMQASPN